MRRLLASFILLTYGLPLAAGDKAGKTIAEHWDAATMRGTRAGHVHTFTEEFDKDGEKLLRTTVELRLKVKRFSDVIELAMDTGTWETREGKVTGVFMRQYLGKTKKLDLAGTVNGNQLVLMLDNQKPLNPAPWRDDVVGLFRQQALFKDKNLKPGDAFSYPTFEPSINLVLNTHLAVKDYEDVEVPGSKQKRRLLRVELKPDQIEKVQLPALVLWLDETLQPIRSEMDIPLLDKIVLVRTTKASALSPGPIAQLADIGFGQLIRLNQRVVKPYETTAARYRIKVKDDADPASTFAESARQKIANLKGDTVELHVKSKRGPGEGDGDAPAAAEFTESSYFINADDPRVRQVAKEAVGGERDAWKKVLRIEKWVNQRMRLTNHEALATADHVARTLEGDCTEFAMLTAAMCRAEGVPSRTAVGLIYADVRGQPSFAFHMWTEVWLRGEWTPIDSTLGKGYVGATHLKICDQSWQNTRNMAPLFPVVRVLGRVSIEVLGVE